ncbi:hypothetical protein ACWEUB_12755 [Staphylococcus xylosus]
MMSTESTLNNMILTAIMLITIYYICYFMLKQRLPFTYRTKSYANLRVVLNYGLQWIANTLVAITATAISYHTIKYSFPNLSDFKNEGTATLFIIMLAILIFSLNFRAILKFAQFLNHVVLYISLKKNNISNNLKHAIANKDEQGIIENHKLIKQTDMKVNLSNEETIILTACLSKHGFNEDVKQMLQPIFYKEQSFLNKFFTTNTNMVEYTVNGIDEDFVTRDTFKHKIKQFNNITNITSYIMSVLFIIQFVIVTFGDALYIPNTIKMIFVILTSVLIISIILIKHRKIKEIYRKELEIVNLPNNHMKIKKPILESILLGLSVMIIIITFIDIFFY